MATPIRDIEKLKAARNRWQKWFDEHKRDDCLIVNFGALADMAPEAREPYELVGLTSDSWVMTIDVSTFTPAQGSVPITRQMLHHADGKMIAEMAFEIVILSLIRLYAQREVGAL